MSDVIPSGEVSTAFRISHPKNNFERVVEGRRLLAWLATGGERVAQEAGWGQLPHSLSTEAGALSVLEIPEGTRSASSVLAGVEAREGEKASILDAVARYAVATYQQEGVVDTGVSLDTVAVTRDLDDRQVFAVPPHTLESDSARIRDWRDNLVGDIEVILRGDPHAADLIQSFRTDLEGIAGS